MCIRDRRVAVADLAHEGAGGDFFMNGRKRGIFETGLSCSTHAVVLLKESGEGLHPLSLLKSKINRITVCRTEI